MVGDMTDTVGIRQERPSELAECCQSGRACCLALYVGCWISMRSGVVVTPTERDDSDEPSLFPLLEATTLRTGCGP
jgi:hypothetical protein